MIQLWERRFRRDAVASAFRGRTQRAQSAPVLTVIGWFGIGGQPTRDEQKKGAQKGAFFFG